MKTTETLHMSSEGLDELQLSEIASILAKGQIAAANCLTAALEGFEQASKAFAHTIRSGGCVHYAAAGSSGLMAAADAQELGGTFSIPTYQLRIHMAGGLPTGVSMPGDTEDETAALEASLSDLAERDCMIAVSASGSTPYTLAAGRIAKARGATLIGIANNAGSELLELADHPILLQTPPEVLAGSTRMGAGTAQKIALNMLSTLMAVELGHIHDGMMVNLYADNAKLKARARSIVAHIAEVAEDRAADALDASGGTVKPAVLIAASGVSYSDAQNLLKETDGHLRPALSRLRNHHITT
ncbi:MAG: N-acetylmuramic acid 6-phosphate etherase [Pseudomonadota bacterium]